MMDRIARKKAEENLSPFRKRHVWIGLAAGVFLGILVGGVCHFAKNSREEAMREWVGRNYLNDAVLECIEYRLFN